MIATLGRPRVQHDSLQHILTIGYQVAASIGGLTTAYGIVRAIISMLDRGRLIARISQLEANNQTLTDTNGVLTDSLSVYKSAADGIADVRNQINALEKKFGEAVVYIRELIAHSRRGGAFESIPQPPAGLRDLIDAVEHQ